MSENQQKELIEIHSFDEIPEFQNEAEEAQFWAVYCLSDELLEQLTPMGENILPPPREVATSNL